MIKTKEALRVAVVIAITIAAQVGLGIWSQQRASQGVALNPLVEPLLFWTLIVFGLLVLIALIGPKHERIWPVAIVFVFVTFFGSFVVGQYVMSIYLYR